MLGVYGTGGRVGSKAMAMPRFLRVMTPLFACLFVFVCGCLFAYLFHRVFGSLAFSLVFLVRVPFVCSFYVC